MDFLAGLSKEDCSLEGESAIDHGVPVGASSGGSVGGLAVKPSALASVSGQVFEPSVKSKSNFGRGRWGSGLSKSKLAAHMRFCKLKLKSAEFERDMKSVLHLLTPLTKNKFQHQVMLRKKWKNRPMVTICKRFNTACGNRFVRSLSCSTILESGFKNEKGQRFMSIKALALHLGISRTWALHSRFIVSSAVMFKQARILANLCKLDPPPSVVATRLAFDESSQTCTAVFWQQIKYQLTKQIGVYLQIWVDSIWSDLMIFFNFI